MEINTPIPVMSEIPCAKRARISEEMEPPRDPKIGDFIRHPTASEDDLLNPNYWFHSNPELHRPRVSDKERKRVQDFYHYTLAVVSKAYYSIKQRFQTSDNLLLVLRDYVTSTALLHFAFAFRRMYDTYLELDEMQRTLMGATDTPAPTPTTTRVTDLQLVEKSYFGSTSPSFLSLDYDLRVQEELQMYVKNRCYSCSLKFMKSANFTSRTEALCSLEKFLLAVEEEFVRVGKPQEAQEDAKVSIKIHSLLLFLEEILNQMDISTQVTPVSVEDNEIMHGPSAEGDINNGGETCIDCVKALNPGMDNSEVVKEVREAVVINNHEESLFSELLHTHLNLFRDNIKRGFVKRYILDDKSVEFLRSLEARVSHLRSNIVDKVVLLKELGSSELKDQVDTLRQALLRDLRSSVSFVGDSQEIYKIFRGLIESMDQRDEWAVWCPSRPKKMHKQL